jgi:hypothetical protein
LNANVLFCRLFFNLTLCMTKLRVLVLCLSYFRYNSIITLGNQARINHPKFQSLCNNTRICESFWDVHIIIFASWFLSPSFWHVRNYPENCKHAQYLFKIKIWKSCKYFVYPPFLGLWRIYIMKIRSCVCVGEVLG